MPNENTRLSRNCLIPPLSGSGATSQERLIAAWSWPKAPVAPSSRASTLSTAVTPLPDARRLGLLEDVPDLLGRRRAHEPAELDLEVAADVLGVEHRAEEHQDEHQQRRKREDGVVGERGRLRLAVVVEELLHAVADQREGLAQGHRYDLAPAAARNRRRAARRR